MSFMMQVEGMMQKDSISFFIQQHLEPFLRLSLKMYNNYYAGFLNISQKTLQVIYIDAKMIRLIIDWKHVA